MTSVVGIAWKVAAISAIDSAGLSLKDMTRAFEESFAFWRKLEAQLALGQLHPVLPKTQRRLGRSPASPA